jgi:hypothetical protein
MRPTSRLFTLTLFVLAILAGPVAAADHGSAVFGGYWQSCLEYWQGTFQKQNGVVMGVIGVGVVALLIITRSGKWQK